MVSCCFFERVGTLQSPFEGYIFLAPGVSTEGSRTAFSEGRKSQNPENELCAVLAPRAGESIKQANRMPIHNNIKRELASAKLCGFRVGGVHTPLFKTGAISRICWRVL